MKPFSPAGAADAALQEIYQSHGTFDTEMSLTPASLHSVQRMLQS